MMSAHDWYSAVSLVVVFAPVVGGIVAVIEMVIESHHKPRRIL
jgi:hypothetical protein